MPSNICSRHSNGAPPLTPHGNVARLNSAEQRAAYRSGMPLLCLNCLNMNNVKKLFLIL